MSAYIVNHSTVQHVLSGLALLEREGGYCITRDFERIGDKTQIGRLLLAMNEQAVYSRHPEARACMGMGSADAETFAYSPSLPCARVQAFKSTEALLYQCHEGDVPETTLFRLLDDLRNTLARWIVSSLPEYQKATWG